MKHLKNYNERLKFNTPKTNNNNDISFDNDEIMTLKEYGFNVGSSISSGEYNGIKIDIQKIPDLNNHTTQITLNMYYGNINILKKSDNNFSVGIYNVLSYLNDNINNYLNVIREYEKENREYNNLSLIKKSLVSKSNLKKMINDDRNIPKFFYTI